MVGHYLPTTYILEASSSLLVKKMQRQRFHIRRYIEGREGMPRWM